MLALVVVTLLIVSVLCQVVSQNGSGRELFETDTRKKKKKTAELIYVYMDGCGHCKEFDPVWSSFNGEYRDSLADVGVSTRKLKNDDRDAKDLGIRAFPSVVLVSETDDFPQKPFSGQRTVSGLASFVQDSFPSFSP